MATKGAATLKAAPPLHFETDPAWINTLRAWAASQRHVLRVWIFGSRATGVRRPKDDATPVPDLDIAYELEDSPSETAYTQAFYRGRSWRAALQAKIPVTVDLQFSDVQSADAKVPEFVRAGGVLIYERDRPCASTM